MPRIESEDPLAIAVTEAIRRGELATLTDLLIEHPQLARTSITHAPSETSRTLLHIATDWPANFPAGAATVAALVEAGADVSARFDGESHRETPLHWAASSDDVAVIDALLDAGADIEARGAVIGDGTALADATAFGQWNAARRLIERGARATLWEAAALGLLDRVKSTSPTPQPLAATTSRTRSGAPAMAARRRRRSTWSSAARTSAGSATMTSRRSTPPCAARRTRW